MYHEDFDLANGDTPCDLYILICCCCCQSYSCNSSFLVNPTVPERHRRRMQGRTRTWLAPRWLYPINQQVFHTLSVLLDCHICHQSEDPQLPPASIPWWHWDTCLSPPAVTFYWTNLEVRTELFVLLMLLQIFTPPQNFF